MHARPTSDSLAGCHFCRLAAFPAASGPKVRIGLLLGGCSCSWARATGQSGDLGQGRAPLGAPVCGPHAWAPGGRPTPNAQERRGNAEGRLFRTPAAARLINGPRTSRGEGGGGGGPRRTRRPPRWLARFAKCKLPPPNASCAPAASSGGKPAGQSTTTYPSGELFSPRWLAHVGASAEEPAA